MLAYFVKIVKMHSRLWLHTDYSILIKSLTRSSQLLEFVNTIYPLEIQEKHTPNNDDIL